MRAERIMISNPVTIQPNVHLGEAIKKMHPDGYRILPVVDAKGTVQGVLSSTSVIAHLLPEYISSGELKDVSFVPDLGVLRKHYLQMKRHGVEKYMDTNPVLVGPDESLLAVTAALVHKNQNECALVVDENRRLLGMITPSDVLHILRDLKLDEAHDA